MEAKEVTEEMIKSWLNAMLMRSIVILGVCFSYISSADEISNWEDNLVTYYKVQTVHFL